MPCVTGDNCCFRDGDQSRDQHAGVPVCGGPVALFLVVYVTMDRLQWNLSSSTDKNINSA